MKKQISDQIERRDRRDPKHGWSTRTGTTVRGTDDSNDVLGPETTEPSAYSHAAEEESLNKLKKDSDHV